MKPTRIGLAKLLLPLALAVAAIVIVVDLLDDRTRELFLAEVALREVEVSIWEAGAAINRLAMSASEADEREYDKQLRDVETYLAEFRAATVLNGASEALVDFETSWSAAVAEFEKVKPLRITLNEALDLVQTDMLAAADGIGLRLQAVLPTDSQAVERARLANGIEVEMARAILSADAAVLRPRRGAAPELEVSNAKIRAEFDKYRAANPSPQEAQMLMALEARWNGLALGIERATTAAQQLEASRLGSTEALHLADDIIDFELQTALTSRAKSYQRDRRLRLWLVLGCLLIGIGSLLWVRVAVDDAPPDREGSL